MTIRKANATTQKPDRCRRVSAAGSAWTLSVGAGSDCCTLMPASPDLHPAVDYKVDAGHVSALVGREEHRYVRYVLRLAEPTQECPAEHLASPVLVLQLP